MDIILVMLFTLGVFFAFIAAGSSYHVSYAPDGLCYICRKNIAEDGYICGKC